MYLSVSLSGSLTNFKQVTFLSVSDVLKAVQTYNYSPFNFRNSYRNKANFQSVSVVVLDIDGGATLEHARQVFQDFRHIIIPTRNHQKEKHGVSCDRFRVILFLETSISDEATYLATWDYLYIRFPFLDKKARDVAHFFFPSPHEAFSVNETGTFVTPVCPKTLEVAQAPETQTTSGYGRLSRKTISFIEDGAKRGERDDSAYRAACDMRDQGYDKETAYNELCKSPCVSLTTDPRDSDPFTIEDIRRKVESAFKTTPDPSKYRPQKRKKDFVPVETFLNTYLQNNEAQYVYKTNSVILNGGAKTIEQFVRRFDLDQHEAGHRYPERLVRSAIQEWVDVQRLQTIDAIIKAIAFDSSVDDAELLAFCSLIDKERRSLTPFLVKHFIWQVKRKLAGKTVDYHVMLILVGMTHSGKTETVKRFLGPIAEVTGWGLSGAIFSDERQWHKFNEHYAIVLDELAKMDQQDIKNIKHVITAEYLQQRIMRMTEHKTYRNSSTLIGTSEESVSEVMYDSKGGRRFWQIATPDRINWIEINKIDFLKIWKGVDETSESPIKEVLEQVQAVQNNEIRTPDNVELFYRDVILPDECGEKTPQEIYDRFKNIYAISAGIVKIPAQRKFMTIFNRLVSDTLKKTVNGLPKYKLKFRESWDDGVTFLSPDSCADDISAANFLK